ncbi:hypothetical protein A2U01_0098915, partial [Trifolium medium]|nr:hypothetical protein [Trifolium medium]
VEGLVQSSADSVNVDFGVNNTTDPDA